MNSGKEVISSYLNSPLYTMEELLSYIDDLQQAMEELAGLLHSQRKKLNSLRLCSLEDDVLKLINELYGMGKNSLEYQSSLDLLHAKGVVSLIQKVLWGEEITDWCLSVALEKLIPGFEILVEKYPDIVMEDARASTMKIFGLARQISVTQIDRQK